MKLQKEGGEKNMAKLSLRPTSPFLSFPSIWEEDWDLSTGQQGLDVYETDDEVVVKAAVPGIKNENIDITYEDGVLHISGKSEETEEEKKRKKVVYQSRRVTSFNYATTLPRAIDTAKLEAEVEDGVLMVTAPLATEAKARKIAVKAKK